MGFHTLSDILRKVCEKNPRFSRRMAESRALSRWDEAVGPVIAKHSRPVKVEDGILWVEVGHPIWRTELHHCKAQILRRLNSGVSTHAGLKTEEMLLDLCFVDPRAGTSKRSERHGK